MELAGPAIDRMGAAGRCASRPVLSLSLSLSSVSPPAVSLAPRSPSLSPPATRSTTSWVLVAAQDAAEMEPMSVDSDGCSGLDAQIEQLMQCRPLPEQEVRSRSAMTRSVRASIRPVPLSCRDLVYAQFFDLSQGVPRVSTRLVS
jgi:serine/threonine-protein phosphatase 2A catalytic subunit